jgi:hypothetical protein
VTSIPLKRALFRFRRHSPCQLAVTTVAVCREPKLRVQRPCQNE